MTAVIETLQAKVAATDRAWQDKLAGDRSAAGLLIAKFEITQKIIADGSAQDAQHARLKFIGVRAEVAAAVTGMPSMPLRWATAAFIQASHLWTDMNSTTPIARARAGIALESLAELVRDQL